MYGILSAPLPGLVPLIKNLFSGGFGTEGLGLVAPLSNVALAQSFGMVYSTLQSRSAGVDALVSNCLEVCSEDGNPSNH